MNPMVNAWNVRICFSLQMEIVLKSENLLIANEAMVLRIFANFARLMGLNMKILFASRLKTVLSLTELIYALSVKRIIS